MSAANSIPPHTIGDGWSNDDSTRMQQVREQERIVSYMCDVYELVDEDELERLTPRKEETAK